MDCKNARLLLDFAPPVPGELDAADAEALQQHLNQCPDCDVVAQSERHFDAAVGRAMNAVAVPDGLRTRLLAKLDRDRDAWYRRYLLRRVLPVAAAAAVLIAVGLPLWNWVRVQRATPELAKLQTDANNAYQATEESVNAWLEREVNRGLRAPSDFNYALLEDYFMSDLNGQRVPTLLFVRAGPGEAAYTARVYILNSGRFNLARLEEEYKTLPPSGAGPVSVELRPAHDPNLTYLVLYTGRDLEPFKDRTKNDGFKG